MDRYYEILGLEPGASPEEVKQAYRDLAKVWHPDRFPNDPRLQQRAHEKLKDINEAYERLQSLQAGRLSGGPQGASRPQEPRPRSEPSGRRSRRSQAPREPQTTDHEKQQGGHAPPWTCVCGVTHSGVQPRCWNCGRQRFGASERSPEEEPRGDRGGSRPSTGEAEGEPRNATHTEDRAPSDDWKCRCGVINAKWRKHCLVCKLSYAEARLEQTKARLAIHAEEISYSLVATAWRFLEDVKAQITPADELKPINVAAEFLFFLLHMCHRAADAVLPPDDRTVFMDELARLTDQRFTEVYSVPRSAKFLRTAQDRHLKYTGYKLEAGEGEGLRGTLHAEFGRQIAQLLGFHPAGAVWADEAITRAIACLKEIDLETRLAPHTQPKGNPTASRGAFDWEKQLGSGPPAGFGWGIVWCVFGLVGGAWSLFLAVYILLISPPARLGPGQHEALAFWLTLIVVGGVISAASAVGVFMRRRWGLIITYVALALMGLNTLVGLFQANPKAIIGIILVPSWLVYFHKRRAWFT